MGIQVEISARCSVCGEFDELSGEYCCKDCRKPFALSKITELAEHFSKQDVTNHPLGRALEQRNRLALIIREFCSAAVPETKMVDRLFEAMDLIIGNTYVEGINILTGDEPDPSECEVAVPGVYVKAGRKVIEELKAFDRSR